MLTGPERVTVEGTMTPLLRDTLFDDPLPKAVTLTVQVYVL